MADEPRGTTLGLVGRGSFRRVEARFVEELGLEMGSFLVESCKGWGKVTLCERILGGSWLRDGVVDRWRQLLDLGGRSGDSMVEEFRDRLEFRIEELRDLELSD